MKTVVVPSSVLSSQDLRASSYIPRDSGGRPPIHEGNFERWCEAFEKGLRQAHAEGRFGWPASELESVLHRFKVAFASCTYNHDGPAVKLACKELGIKHTRRSIESYLRAPAEVPR
jgi:hypothetical protein